MKKIFVFLLLYTFVFLPVSEAKDMLPQWLWHGWEPDYNQVSGMKSPIQGNPCLIKEPKVGHVSERWNTLRFIFRNVKE